MYYNWNTAQTCFELLKDVLPSHRLKFLQTKFEQGLELDNEEVSNIPKLYELIEQLHKDNIVAYYWSDDHMRILIRKFDISFSNNFTFSEKIKWRIT